MSIICGQIASGQENKRYFVLKLIFNCKTKSFIFDTDPLWKILRVARRNVTVGTLVVSNCTFFFSLYSFENSLQHSFSYCVSLVFRYCECFSAKQYCQDCNCEGCCNNEEHRALVEDAVAHVIERNPNAFLSKVETPVTILYHIFVHFRFNKRNFEWFWGHHFILIECYWLVFVSPDFLYRETTKDVIVEKQIASKNIVNVFKYIYIYTHTDICYINNIRNGLLFVSTAFRAFVVLQAGVACNANCRCTDCKNYEGSLERSNASETLSSSYVNDFVWLHFLSIIFLILWYSGLKCIHLL